MKVLFFAAAGALSVLPAAPSAAAPAPLTQEALDSATFQQWQARRHDAEAVAATAEADPTIPDTTEAPASGAPAPGTTSNGSPSTSAENSVAAPKVEVTGEPDKAVATPDYSTDLPDEAGLESADEPEAPDPFMVRLQVLLDRANASPGVIDGYFGENTKKAIRSYEEMRGLPVDGEPDADLWNVLTVDKGRAMTTYRITKDDVEGRYIDSLPDDYAELAKMDWLGFHGPVEMLAERFHMDEELLKALNSQTDFKTPGDVILVAEVGKAATAKVLRVVVDKQKGELTAFDGAGAIVLSAPATIGSADTPSPTGTVTVVGVAPDPTYSYDPQKNFTQGSNTSELTLPPGPNGPVGSMWIDLSKPTYGIHGTAHPALIDKSVSHGCVRLTNWDAEALAKLVEPQKTTVEFKG
ncbi:L,D-transpeptidase [Aurantimonas sp. VKM B-3413]|uniref:L,D-transpeptidase family protein n=1 Tax=Aurantimonas sp. VKM B-3413 TaxID=2779401 RepID=UPI001E597039|nr:L,D-transpeptidase [Aurantimonas sp. VKM B-3413]MCB8840025.1 L,D-transpeptidase [Aurantimonas sp. VKM B-3413]